MPLPGEEEPEETLPIGSGSESAIGMDVWGMGLQILPTGEPGKYNHGPDQWRGPARCRGGDSPSCGYPERGVSDHSCCCDPCRHDQVNICLGTLGCCKCVPKAICAYFSPYDTGTCDARYFFMESDNGIYTFSAGNIGDVTIMNGPPQTGKSSNMQADCVWSLEIENPSSYYDEPIDHYGNINCMTLPDWNVSGVTINDCVGDLSFSIATLQKIPFEKKYYGINETFEHECAYCTGLCSVLCVRRGQVSGEYTRTEFTWNAYSERYEAEDDSGEYTRTEFTWNAYSERYEAEDDSEEYIDILSSGGKCYYQLTDITPATFLGDLVEINSGECSLGLDLTIYDEANRFLQMSCNPCSCWKYICGTCRCVCRNLCVVGVVENNPFRDDLVWDTEELQWVGSSGLTIGLSEDEDGLCALNASIFTDSTSFDECGWNIGAQFQEDIDVMLETGELNYLYLYCKQCEGGCTSGSCLDICDAVPSVLVAEVCPGPWMAMVGCDYCPLCFECVTFDLNLVFIPDRGVAGEWRWQGNAIISCSNCCDVSRNYFVSVDVGCDGIIYFTVSNPSRQLQACSEQFSFTLPCDGSGIWDFEFETEQPCGVLNGCCDNSYFILRITE